MGFKEYRKEVTEKIINMIEEGTAPWQKQWNPLKIGSLLPQNAISENKYRGANAMNLMVEQQVRNSEDPRWCTFKQINDNKWHLKKGSKGVKIEYWDIKKEEKINSETNKKEEIKKMVVRYYTVFNGKDIEGIPPIEKNVEVKWQPNDIAEDILKKSGADIKHDQIDKNFYTPKTDVIHLVPKNGYDNAQDYYGVVLHELSHWSGHPGRMNRFSNNLEGRTKEDIAKEELRAEMGSFYVSLGAGIAYKPSNNNAAYVKSWLQTLENDHNEFFKAASDAEKIADYILEFGKEKILQNQQKNEVKEDLGKVERIENIKQFEGHGRNNSPEGFYKENASIAIQEQPDKKWEKEIDTKIVSTMMLANFSKQQIIDAVMKNSPEFPNRKQITDQMKVIEKSQDFKKENQIKTGQAIAM